MRFTRVAAVLLFTALSLGMVSCGKDEPGRLSVGLMPAVNSIPIIIAQEEGYFTDENVDVELVMFKSQLNREAALQSGEIDGSISDMINAINEWHGGMDIRVTSLSDGRFALLSSPQSGIRTLEDWKAASGQNVRTGLLENSIVFYVSERMLQAAGADSEMIELVPTTQIPVRMEMLLAGELDAACLPEPITRVAAAAGAHILAETDVLSDPPGVLLFTGKALKDKSDEIRAFYRAYNRAVEDLNRDADAYRDVIVETGEFPPPVRNTMVLPDYSPARAPAEESFTDVVGWMKEKGLIEKVPAYEDIVSLKYLPEAE